MASVGFLLTIASTGNSQEKEEPAISAAEKWLALVDEGKYEESWEAASGYFRGAVKKEEWESSMVGVRKPLGDVITRELGSSEYRISLPGAPDGEYVVIRFDTSFENKASSVETVTPVKEGDVWKVSGYYIR
jgi:hypothetical protein